MDALSTVHCGHVGWAVVDGMGIRAPGGANMQKNTLYCQRPYDKTLDFSKVWMKSGRRFVFALERKS